MRWVSDKTISELSYRMPDAIPMQGLDYATLYDIAAAAIKAAQEMEDDDAV